MTPKDRNRAIALEITRGLGISITDPDESALRVALAEIYATEGFGGREDRIESREDARVVVAERLAWLRDQRAECLR